MQATRVLLVDDESMLLEALTRALTIAKLEVIAAHDASEALELLQRERCDVVVCDVNMPGINGIELVRQIRALDPNLPCIVLTGYSSGERSIEALRAGAFWYLEKDARDLGGLVRRLVDQAVESGRLRVENRALRSELRALTGHREIIGRSEAFRRVMAQVERIADADSTVLLSGESGTGKEVIARALHAHSSRADKMMVAVNCAALPEELLESELFGHVRGAFTNAVASRVGRFTLADGGTLFLDEVGEMSARLQAKLLRVLQERSFEPVGSSTTVHVDVRVVAATNQDLVEAIREKRFREDLYYRLAVIPIEVPPLRERREDIVPLTHHFLEQKARALGGTLPKIEPAVLDRLCQYDWPGNVRELENLIERLVVFARGATIGVGDLPKSIGATERDPSADRRVLPTGGIHLESAVRELEADLIQQALERTHWNKQRAAELLHMSRPTLFTKIQRAGLNRPHEAGGSRREQV